MTIRPLSIAALALVALLSDAGHSATYAADEGAAPAAAPTATSTATETATMPAIPAKPEQTGVVLSAAPPSPGDGETTAAEMVAELRKRRDEADARDKVAAARETELKAREQALDEELKKLQSVRDDIARTAEARKKENDDRVLKIVDTVETMSPKSAAPLLAAMDETLAVAAMGKIATPKLAKIMNVMEPQKSARLSELLAGVVRARNAESRAPAHVASNGATETTAKSAKGGEEDVGHSQ